MTIVKGISLKAAWNALVVLLMLVPTLSLGAWGLNKAYHALLFNATLHEKLVNAALAHKIDTDVERMLTVLRNKTDAFDYLLKQHASKPIDDLLALILQREPNIVALHLISRNGGLLAQASSHPGQPAPLDHPITLAAGLPELLQPLAGAEYIGEETAHDGRHFFHVGIPVGADSHPQAVLLATVNMEGLWENNQLPDIQGGGTVRYLVNAKGRVVDGVAPLAADYLRGDSPILRGFNDRPDWDPNTLFDGIDGEPVFGELAHLGSLNWAVVSEVPKISITRPILNTLVPMAVLVSVLVVGFIALGIRLSNKTLAPLAELSAGMKRAELGDYSFVPPASKITEFKNIATSYRAMVEAIEDRRQQYETSLRETEQAEIAALNMMEDVELARERLHDSFIESINTLIRAAEYRDDETGAHVRRISHYSRLLATELGMDEEFCDTIFYASAMHDIGKIGIPDHILLKPAAFTPPEWELMKTHAVIGSKILGGNSSPYFRMGEQIALCHHEQWSGDGYPHGLAGEEIPLAARIMKLADVYDALRSHRPYKVAFDHAKAVQIITHGDGRTHPDQFDPDVLAAFVRVAAEMQAIFAAANKS